MLVEDKSLAVHTVRTVLALQVYLLRVKQHSLVQIAFEVIRLKKVAMPINLARNQSLQKALALETLTPIHHAVFDVVSNKKIG